jgi:hypothetical protein
MNRIQAWRRSVAVWLYAALLAAFPFADQIIQGVNDNLPALAQYLPPNVYKVVGLLVVLFNIVHAARSAAKKVTP